MKTINCMLWTVNDVIQGEKGASSTTSRVSVLKGGSFQPIPTPDKDQVDAVGEQLVIYTMIAPGWEFVSGHDDQRAPDGAVSAYPGTPLLMAANDQVSVVSWSATTLVLRDRNTDQSVYPFFVSLTNPDRKGSEDDYWDPQIRNDGSGND